MDILGIDRGKFKSTCCMLNTDTHEADFWPAEKVRDYLRSMHALWPVPAAATGAS